MGCPTISFGARLAQAKELGKLADYLADRDLRNFDRVYFKREHAALSESGKAGI